MSKANSKVAQFFVYGIILVISLYFMAGKSTYFVDEIYSFGLSNSNYMPFLPSDDTWKTPDYYLDYLSVINDGFDYKSVWFNQSVDVHPPLYYSIIHSISSIFKGIFSKWIGLGINISAMIGVYWLLYKISVSTGGGYKGGLFSSILYGSSYWYYSDLLFIRMYALTAFLSILLLYLHIQFYQKNKMNLADYIKLFFSLMSGMLTHYFFGVYACFLCIIFCSIILKRKKYKEVLLYIITLALSGIFYIKIWPHIFNHVFGNTGNGLFDILFSFNEFHALGNVIKIFKEHSFGYIVLPIVLCVMWVLFRKKVYNKGLFLLLLLPPALTILVTAGKIMQSERYMYPFIPCITVFISFYFCHIIKDCKSGQYIFYLTAVIAAVCNLVNMNPSFYKYYDDYYMKEMSALDGLNCVYINEGWAKYTANVPEFIQYSNIYVTNSNDIAWMSNDKIVQKSNQLIIYIDYIYDSDTILNNILSFTDYSKYALMTDTYSAKVYLLEK